MIIGDGTAPPGFPAYSAYQPSVGECYDIICNYNKCGHRGVNGKPCVMECGRDCDCPCCWMLQGERVHGVTYG